MHKNMSEAQSVYPFHTPTPPLLNQVGGKAQSLILMTNAEFPVPNGFVLSVDFFQPWLSDIKNSPAWQDFVADGDSDSKDIKSLCDSVKSFCSTLKLTNNQNEALQNALKNHPLEALFAVRSSSPEEDLDGASFAGGYETVLGVRREGVEEALVRCFSSAFDERVVRYKTQLGIQADNPRIAVIIQEQIASDVSGVAFSLNPQNNCYDETVINANFGLGETVVSGQVTPDAFVVNKIKKEIVETKTAKKDNALWLTQTDGTENRDVTDPLASCLKDNQILEITEMVGDVERYYQKPMDIEWTYHDNKLYLLQARPITGYFPLPDSLVTHSSAQKYLYLNLNLIKQGITGLMSPLGVGFFSTLMAMTSFIAEDITKDPKDGIYPMQEGLILTQVGNTEKMLGQKMFISSIDIGGKSVIDTYKSIDMHEYLPKELPKPLAATRWKMFWFVLKQIPDMVSMFWNPEQYLEKYKQNDARQAREHVELCSKDFETLQSVVDDAIKVNFQECIYQIGALIIGARWSKHEIYKMFKDDNVNDLLVCLEMALPGNKTAEMGQLMYELAKQSEIQDTPDAETFLQKLNDREFSLEFLSMWDKFITDHGFRGMGELEISTPRSYENLPDLFAKMKDMSEQAKKGERTVFEIAKQKHDNAYKHLREMAAKSGQRCLQKLERNYGAFIATAGLRENPKYNLIRALDLIRRRALNFGEVFAQQNRLDEAKDVFNLSIDQVDMALCDSEFDLRAAIERNTSYAKRIGKRDIPTFFDSRGRIFRPPVNSIGDNAILGEPISPGVVTGHVNVLMSAHEKPVLPGEILVAKATDPGWTPLFINAGAIILENGGTLQHGAVVAREYGKPCVSSVVDATKVLKDGQLIEVNGSNGIIKILD